MLDYDGIPNIDLVRNTLSELFAIEQIESVHQLTGGHLCKSFTIKTPTKTFFLKQYRHRISRSMSQIKFAEEFFAQGGIPVLLPIKDSYGRSAFLMGKNWYSLFPFLDDRTKAVHELNDTHLTSMGVLLAKIHQAGKGISDSVTPIDLWDENRFNLEVVEVERELARRPRLNRIETTIQNMIEAKKRIIKEKTLFVEPNVLHYDTLLHGDFSYQNTFFNEDGSQIKHIYDLEKAARGPREFELARAMFINCFDDGWEDANITRAITFLSAYQNIYPTTQEAFLAGVRMYLANITQQTWIEVKVLVKNAFQYLDLLEIHARKIKNINEGVDQLSREIFQKSKENTP